MKNVLLFALLLITQWSFAQVNVDAALYWDSQSLYLFKDQKIVVYNYKKDAVTSTLTLQEAFKGVTFDKVDAALDYGNGKIYFFRGKEYTRYDRNTQRVDPNYPKPIKKYWPGLHSSPIDAAINWTNGKTYFFHGKQYSRFDRNNDEVDEHYPKNTNAQTWPDLSWTNVDAAVTLSAFDKTYIFKGNQYVRFDNKKDQVDAGYPKNIREWNGVAQALGNDKPTPTPVKGMQFFEGNWEAALLQAKKENKLIFVDAYAAWCGPCKWMNANTFPDGQVGQFFNKHFINVKMDMEKGKGPTFGKKYPVSAYPTLFFMDKEGNVKEKVRGARDAKEFLALGKDIIKKYGKVAPTPTPNNDDNNGSADNFNYKGTFSTSQKTIDLSPYKASSPSSVLADFKLKKGSNDKLYLAFQQKHDAIIMVLDAKGQRQGQPIVLSNYWLSDLRPMSDGSLAILAGKDINNTYIKHYPNTLYFIKISASGSIGTPKHIFGGKGHGPQKSWFDGRSEAKLTYNGKNFGVYFEVQKNWAKAGQKEDIHNGDMFVVLDQSGNIDDDKTHFWTASHSSTVQTAAMNDGDFWTMTIGDASPYGLQVYNRSDKTNFIAWPPKEYHLTYEEVNSTNAAGILHFMDATDGVLTAFLGTVENPNIGWKTKVDPLFLKMDKNGNILKKKYLRQTADIDEGVISVFPLRDKYVVAMGAGNEYSNNWEAANFEVTVIDENAKTLLAPTKINKPFGSNSQLVPITAKKMVWCNAAYSGLSKLEWHQVVFD